MVSLKHFMVIEFLKSNNILVLSTNKSVRIQFFRKGRYDLFCVLVNRYVGFSLFKKSIV